MKISTLVLCVAAVTALSNVVLADITLFNNMTAYTQNFDTLAATEVTAGTSTIMPTDWSFAETGGGANTGYAVSTGSALISDTYSYGAAAVAERALGELTAAAVISRFGAKFKNTSTDNPIPRINLSYIGEQWRSQTATSDRLDFQYSLNATGVGHDAATWVDVNALDFVGPVNTNALMLNGNLPANQVAISVMNLVLTTPIAPGGVFWIRWRAIDATGGDHGLGIDNFSIQAIPEPSSFALCGLLFGAMGIGLVRRRRRIAS